MIPALVIAREFCRRHSDAAVLFVGTPRGIENRLVPEAGFALELLQVGLLQGQSAATRVRTLLELPTALWRAGRVLARFQPQVVLGVGGYAAGPVMLQAAWSGIPLAVLEPNAYPGLTNRWVAPYVSRAFVGFPEAASYFHPNKVTEAGIPVREEFFRIRPRPHRPPFTVLVFGGSQGARSINRAVVEALPKLDQFGESLLLLHQTGETEYNAIREAYAQHASSAIEGVFDRWPHTQVFGNHAQRTGFGLHEEDADTLDLQLVPDHPFLGQRILEDGALLGILDSLEALAGEPETTVTA